MGNRRSGRNAAVGCGEVEASGSGNGSKFAAGNGVGSGSGVGSARESGSGSMSSMLGVVHCVKSVPPVSMCGWQVKGTPAAWVASGVASGVAAGDWQRSGRCVGGLLCGWEQQTMSSSLSDRKSDSASLAGGWLWWWGGP